MDRSTLEATLTPEDLAVLDQPLKVKSTKGEDEGMDGPHSMCEPSTSWILRALLRDVDNHDAHVAVRARGPIVLRMQTRYIADAELTEGLTSTHL